jgi:hypothetical protein
MDCVAWAIEETKFWCEVLSEWWSPPEEEEEDLMKLYA